jgi:hypothetical protein
MFVALMWRRVMNMVSRAFTLLRNGITCLRFGALLNAGADVNGVDKNGFTPLHKVYDLECTKLFL